MLRCLTAGFMLYISFFIAGITVAHSRDVNITAQMPYTDIRVGKKSVRIERIQNTKHKLKNSFALTSRKCPPFCVHPMKAAEGIETVGELELIKFLKTKVEGKKGLLIDARIQAFYQKGTIPGAVNIPFNLFAFDQNPYLEKILAVLGGVRRGENQWDYSNALHLMLFCNGPWCDQSPRALKNLVEAGYPAGKLSYYRGGMQSWQNMGLTVSKP